MILVPSGRCCLPEREFYPPAQLRGCPVREARLWSVRSCSCPGRIKGQLPTERTVIESRNRALSKWCARKDVKSSLINTEVFRKTKVNEPSSADFEKRGVTKGQQTVGMTLRFGDHFSYFEGRVLTVSLFLRKSLRHFPISTK